MRNLPIECEEFYSLMQTYRHASVTDQDRVIEAYENVKTWIRKWHRKQERNKS